MKTINVQVQWRMKHGWTYRAYEFSDNPDDVTTAVPFESGGISELVPGLDDLNPTEVQTHQPQLEAAIQARFPGATTQFGKVPVNHP